MAKLTGVTTVDMVNGEITKVEYEGAVYKKIAHDFQDAKTGDVFLNSRTGGYYEITIRDSDYFGIPHPVRFKNEDGSDNGYMRGCSIHPLYRKVTEVSQPFAEMITAKVDAVEKRVTALEGEKKPKFSEGDRVKTLTCCEDDDIEAGEYGVVVDTDCGSHDDPYSIRVDTDDDYGYFRPQDLEMASETLKVGDYAVITGGRIDDLVLGDVVKLVEEAAGISFDFYAERFSDRKEELFKSTQLRKATDAEVAAATAPAKPKTGDIVVITGESHRESRGCHNEIGDIGVVVKRGDTFKTSVKVSVPGRSQYSNYTHESEMRLATPAEIEKYEASLVQMMNEPTLKVGDIVRVEGSEWFKDGAITKVKQLGGWDGDDPRYVLLEGGSCGLTVGTRYVTKLNGSCAFTKAGRKPNEYREGDVVRVLSTLGTEYLDVGQITEVVTPDGTDEPEVRSNDGDTRYAKVEIVCFAENRADAKEVA